MDNEFQEIFNSLPEENKKEVMKKLEYERVRAETKLRLETDPSIQEYFKSYNIYSIGTFKMLYPIHKANWMVNWLDIPKIDESFDLQYVNAAKEGLAMILKRKALQRIAEWNAYQAEYDGIETSIDFAMWSADIFNVPYIEPITRFELDIYLKYRTTDYYDMYDNLDLPMSYRLQLMYRKMNVDDDGEDNFCRLYNTLAGAGTYLVLPTTKTDIEGRYEDNFRNYNIDKHNKDIAEGRKEQPVRDERPNLPTEYYNANTEFVMRFENDDVIKKYREYIHHEQRDIKESLQIEQEERLLWHLKSMFRENEPFPIAAHDDFREAIKTAFIEFEKHKTIEAIETAYEDYLFRIENKMSFEKDEEKIEHALDYIRRTKEYLLEARVFAGEPADLNMF